MDNLENKTAKAILQQPVEVVIGEKTYQVAPPTIATLILVSEAISKLPKVNLDNEKIASESLNIAKDCAVLGEIVAILILGAKELIGTRKSLFGTKEVDRKAILATEILSELNPKQLSEMLNKLLAGMELGFFFQITTSLIEINLLRKTKEAETTASGR